MKHKRFGVIFGKGRGSPTHRAYYGKPACLFKDSDKDGVPNVFDCQPFNKKKQDVIAPKVGGGFRGMYARQEYGRQYDIYQKQLEEAQKIQQQQQEAWTKEQAEQERAWQEAVRKEQARLKSLITASQPPAPSGGYKIEIKDGVKVYTPILKQKYERVKDGWVAVGEPTLGTPITRTTSTAPAYTPKQYTSAGSGPGGVGTKVPTKGTYYSRMLGRYVTK